MTGHRGEDVTATLRERIANAIARPENYGWDVAPFLAMADAVIDALGIERLGLLVGSGGPDRPAWGHRWTIGDRVVSVDHEHRWDRDVPLFRIRAAETEWRAAETGQRLADIRSWRDQTEGTYGQPHAPSDTPMVTNNKGWWRDVDALLDALDEAQVTERES